MSEHTPGPWTVEVDDQSGIGRTHAVYVCAGSWPEGQLARVNVQDGLGEREANARLIAAAPDLLAACEAVEQRIVEAMDLERISPAAALEELGELLRPILAKTRGQA